MYGEVGPGMTHERVCNRRSIIGSAAFFASVNWMLAWSGTVCLAASTYTLLNPVNGNQMPPDVRLHQSNCVLHCRAN
jgi:hypothetical protein